MVVRKKTDKQLAIEVINDFLGVDSNVCLDKRDYYFLLKKYFSNAKESSDDIMRGIFSKEKFDKTPIESIKNNKHYLRKLNYLIEFIFLFKW